MPAPGQPYNRTGLAIINPYGGIWTDTLFQTEQEALKYLKSFWGDQDVSRFRLACASVEVKLELGGDGEPIYVSLPNGERS